MNIKEAYAKATPGPLLVKVLSQEAIIFSPELAHMVCKAGCPIDMALLAHAYNHLPKVLEALKSEHDGNVDNIVNECGGVHIPEACDVCKLIAEASEVKI